MSAIFLVVPVISAVPAFAAAVAAVGGALGYAVHRGKAEQAAREAQRTEVDLPIKEEKTLERMLEQQGDFLLTKGDLQLAIARDARGRCHVRVSGKGHSPEELEALGSGFFYEVVRRYTYQQVKGELQAKGFSMVDEERQADGTVKLHVRRWA